MTRNKSIVEAIRIDIFMKVLYFFGELYNYLITQFSEKYKTSVRTQYIIISNTNLCLNQKLTLR